MTSGNERCRYEENLIILKGNEFMIGKNQILINQMLNGDVDAIKIGLNSDNTALKINAIIHSTVFCVDDDIVISKIKEMKKDRDYLRICAFTVGEFATASLHLRGIEKYSGSNHSILRLIESKFQF